MATPTGSLVSSSNKQLFYYTWTLLSSLSALFHTQAESLEKLSKNLIWPWIYKQHINDVWDPDSLMKDIDA